MEVIHQARNTISIVRVICRWMALAKAIIYYGLPLLVIAIFYSLMAQRLLASTREMPGALHGGQGEAQAKARKSVALMVLIFVIGEHGLGQNIIVSFERTQLFWESNIMCNRF